MMTRPNVKMTKKQLVLLVIIAAGLAVFGILTAISSAIARTQTTQYSAEYWDPDGRYSMVSVFLPEDNPITQSKVQQLEYTLDQALIKEAIEAPADNARLYVSSYSAKTQVSLSSAVQVHRTVRRMVWGEIFSDSIIMSSSVEAIFLKTA